MRVLAGPGTGKTATIVEAVADRILHRGVDPSSLLVLTFSRRAAAELASRIAARVATTIAQPLVRTLHSYAYAVVRSAAVAAGDPPPRLLDAGQADLMVREMLAGHAQDGVGRWPDDLRAALRVPAFATELREFLLRTGQRQLGPRQIAALARRAGRPEWLAAAHFVTEYRDIGDLRQASGRMGTALDQAELITAALDRLAVPEVLAAQQARIRRIFVDEYQDVDPAQARLVDLLASGADELVVVGDPDQSIYAFRGAAAGALQRVPVQTTVALDVSHRMPRVLIEASRRVAGRLPGPAAHRVLRASDPSATGSLAVRVLASPAQEAAFVADQLRRAHLAEGVPWSRMAVVLRSPAQQADSLRRACGVAGVPLRAAPAPPAADPLVAAVLVVLSAAVQPASLTGPGALALLASPLVGLDPMAVRRLRRAVRAVGAGSSDASSGTLLAAILTEQIPIPAGLPADLDRPVRQLVELVALARAGAGEPAAETVLWRVWQRAGMERALLAASERGGRVGAEADGMLDAAVSLFERAAELADQLPGAGVRGLLEVLAEERIVSGDPPRAGVERVAEAVTMLSAHAAKGLQWDVVLVPGVQQDTWPDLRPRTSLLDLAGLLDAAAGIDPGLPAADALAEERRLFYVAVTRARGRLVVTAVQDDERVPSRFVAEIAGPGAVATGWPTGPAGEPRRALQLPALVADLRRAVTAAGGDGAARHRAELAAQALARLAAAGVPGAHPDDWHGLAELSTAAPVTPPGSEVVLSPSQIESLLACPLRAALERHGARDAPGQAQLIGIAVHALAQGISDGASEADLDAATDEFLAAQDRLPPWEVARMRRLLEAMRGALRSWLHQEGARRTFVASEQAMQVRLPEGSAGHPEDGPVRLVGRADHLSMDEAGRMVVTDFKSGSTIPTRAAVVDHAQLAAYQVGVALGGFDPTADAAVDRVADAAADQGAGTPSDRPAGAPAQRAPDPAPAATVDSGATGGQHESGGAELVYLRSGRPKTLRQPPLSASDRDAWIERLRGAARSAASATPLARAGDGCERCPVRSSCPLQPEGRQVTG